MAGNDAKAVMDAVKKAFRLVAQGNPSKRRSFSSVSLTMRHFIDSKKAGRYG